MGLFTIPLSRVPLLNTVVFLRIYCGNVNNHFHLFCWCYGYGTEGSAQWERFNVGLALATQ